MVLYKLVKLRTLSTVQSNSLNVEIRMFSVAVITFVYETFFVVVSFWVLPLFEDCDNFKIIDNLGVGMWSVSCDCSPHEPKSEKELQNNDLGIAYLKKIINYCTLWALAVCQSRWSNANVLPCKKDSSLNVKRFHAYTARHFNF
ncbi:hypothetical protein L596_021790 [Steinernema carpocapsae]|uniref:Uncharacterized protein n=1 Tax=Steinernema carpocapsae TaxID=34508 RepID=A0A4U5MJT1_STECR|nr:hypothetical protein L596_021790 [Steinernema carpocapsae]